jgi:hypothetical protein
VAHTELTTAMDLYRVMDMTFWLPQVETALAQIHRQEEAMHAKCGSDLSRQPKP